ncbi:fimbria/pilus outer membrane usher protein [Lysobacter panacisoli]|uniref:Fimbrial biogenesis outer membrane usher protein n=1 Tax=Lysobacter panacisoli TaxID=1255263 RepID=A0ABP9L673_9GAMM|nr:fimbria/pilus outer membrane usher protein [Lysobacter panacisoli]
MKPLSLVVLSALGYLPSIASAAPAPEPAPDPTPEPVTQFDTAFLGESVADMSRFERANVVLPGDYSVDVFVNQSWLGRESVSFRAPSASESAKPCLTPALLEGFGVDMVKLETVAPGSQAQECIDLESVIPDSRVTYDGGELRLDLSIPQASMNRRTRGYVNPKSWDDGVTAAMLNYTFNTYHSELRGFEGQLSASLGIDAGLNIGGWRIRQRSHFQWAKGSHGHEDVSHWQNTATYAQHDITPWRSQLTLGDTSTTGEIFDSLPFRGVRIASDDRMLPDSLVGYAPTVRGVAQTNAHVEIRQNGYIVYETTVAPGPFEIADLYASGYGGDLEVTVTEADGRVSTFVVPYGNVPQLLRPGSSRYSATIGQVRSYSRSGADLGPLVAEGTYQRGINNFMTLYGGAQAAERSLYSGVLAGAAFATPIGAVAADITYSKAKFAGADDSLTGRSARVTYSKSIPETHTDFALAAYRYSSRGYIGLAEAAALDQGIRDGLLVAPDNSGFGRQRSRFQLSLNQRLGERAGSLFASGSRSDYWDRQFVDTSYQLGWSNTFRSLSYGISANRTRDLAGRYDNQYYVSLRMPLGSPTGRSIDANAPQLSLASNHGPRGDAVRATVGGSGGRDQEFNYSVSATSDSSSGRNDANVGTSLQYRAPYASLGGSYTYARNYQQASLSASGAIVAHPGGVTFSQPLGETIAVVHAKGAAGAHIPTHYNLKLDRRGYAVVSNLMPYRMNDIQVDPKGLGMDVELDTTLQRVAPRAGAVVAVSFDTSLGRAFFVRGLMQDGKTLPFGAQVLDEHGIEIGLVGQNGLAFVRSPADSGNLTVKWGGGPDQACSMPYHVPASGKGNGYQQVDAQCTFQRIQSSASLQ